MIATRFCALLAAVLALSAEPLFSQIQVQEGGGQGPPTRSVFGIGLSASVATGLGVSVRHHLPSPFSYQIAGGVISVDDRLSYDIGAEMQFDLIRGSIQRIYAAWGASYFHTGRSRKGNELEGPGRIGLGLGGEFLTAGHMHISGALMFTYFTDGTLLPLPSIATHFYFM